MCGRYTLADVEQERLGERFVLVLDELRALGLGPRFNIAPGQDVLAVMAGEGGRRRPALLRWGLTPSWSRDGSPGPINARAESAGARPMFRAAIRRARCLLPADGFYEWRRDADGRKTPMRFTLRDGGMFALAGIAERWAGPDGRTVRSCAVLTTAPNPLVAPVHDRMPVILRPAHEALWLDPAVTDPADLAPAWEPFPAEAMTAYPVSQRVNSPRNDDAECARPAAARPA